MSSHDTAPAEPEPGAAESTRRGFLGASAAALMTCGLAGAYGGLGAMAVRYLYPAHGQPMDWMYVARIDQISAGAALLYKSPSGEPINIARHSAGTSPDDFIALSSVCPHLGCQVLWESADNRFFCPCHNGAFDAQGHGTSGPPKGQSLLRYPLKIENGMLFIEVPLDSLQTGGGRA